MSDPLRPTPEPAPKAHGNHPLWLLGLVVCLAWHGWMTLGLFGSENPLGRLLDDQPLLSGRHPLHLYHGRLGARSLHDSGSPSCFDPAFCAGYPKTPVFDSGCRPAELLLYLTGTAHSFAVYKIGLAVLWLIVPLLIWLSARAACHFRFDALLATILGLLVWWGGPCRSCLEAGDLDICLGAVLALVQAAFLLRYHRFPGPGSLLGLTLGSLFAWFTHPLLMGLLVPIFLIYYLSVGTRHRLSWHLALWSGLAVALGLNAYWLIDWVRYWWIRLPPGLEAGLSPSWSFKAVWSAPLWGDAADRALACVLVGGAIVGCIIYNATSRRPAARLLGLSAALTLTITIFGLLSEPLSRLGATQGLLPALIFSTLPAAYFLGALCRKLASRNVLLSLIPIAAVVGGLFSASPSGWSESTRWIAPRPLIIGLGPARTKLVVSLKDKTTAQARILWEDRRAPRGTPQWTALLPLLTDRAYIGGLDPDADIEHAASGLSDQILAGRAIDEWTDADLADYCDRYNIGWVVCWSPRAVKRFTEWSAKGAAEKTMTLPDADGSSDGVFFTIKRRHSFARLGSVNWISADSRRIVLGEVVPENGEVILSLHHQNGMRVTPSRVKLGDPVQNDPDSIPFIRLQVDSFVSRITITWEKR